VLVRFLGKETIVSLFTYVGKFHIEDGESRMENIFLESLFFVVTSMGYALFGTVLLILLDNLFAYSRELKKISLFCLILLILLSTSIQLEYADSVIMSAAPILLILMPLDKRNLYSALVAYLVGTWLSGGYMLTAVLFSVVNLTIDVLMKQRLLKIYVGFCTLLPILFSEAVLEQQQLAYDGRALWSVAIVVTVVMILSGLAMFMSRKGTRLIYFREYLELFFQMFNEMYTFYYSGKADRVYFSKKMTHFLGLEERTYTWKDWQLFLEEAVVNDKRSQQLDVHTGFFLIPGVGDVRHIRFEQHAIFRQDYFGFVRDDTRHISKQDILYVHTQKDTLTNFPKSTVFAEHFLEKVKEQHTQAKQDFLLFFLEIDLRTAGYSVYDSELEVKFHKAIFDAVRDRFSDLEVFSIVFGEYILVLPYEREQSGELLKTELIQLLNARIEMDGMMISSFNRMGFRDTYTYEIQTYEDAQEILKQLLYCRSVLKKESLLYYYQFKDYEYKEYIKKQRRVRFLSTIIQHEKIYAVYQPIMDTDTGKPMFFEVLTRVDHDAYKNTGTFFEDIQEFSLTRETDRIIFKRLRDALEKRTIPAYHYSVNISSDTMFDDNIAWIADFLYTNGFYLYLELSERSRRSIKYVEEREYFAKKHHAVLVADDYGTESSNIELLYDFNFNCVKIPRKFIVAIDKDQKQKLFVSAINQYCEQFGLGCIAEGVETEAEKQALHELGMHLMQGYVFGQPASEVNL